MCGAFRRAVLAYSAHHLAISGKHLAAIFAIWQQTREFAGDVIGRKRVGNKFAHHLTVGYQIDQRDILHLQYVATQESNEAWQRSLVAHHLRHIEQGCLERCRSARHNGGTCMREKGVGVVVDKLHAASVYKLAVIVHGYSGGASQEDCP